MKKLTSIGLLGVTAFLNSGCHTIKLGDAKVTSFGQKVSIQELEVNPKTGAVKVKGYNLDQVQGMIELFNEGRKVGESLAKGGL